MDAALGRSILQTPLLDAHRAAGANIGEWFNCALPSDFGDWRGGYRFARESGAPLYKKYRAYLLLTGPDRLRYLNSIPSKNIKELQNGRGGAYLFLNPQ